MSQFPPPGPNPPPYHPPYWPPPAPHHYPPHPPIPPHYPHDQAHNQPHTYPYFVPGVILPVPMPSPVPMPPPPEPPSSTYITNYIYHGEPSSTPDPVRFAENPGDFTWIPSTATTAQHLSGKAVVGGHEGWDGSPLWVIRAWHSGDLIPGKLSVRHSSASVMYNGKEVPVQNIEVLCARQESLRWLPASNGSVPAGAVPGGTTSTGETLYVGRARYQLSVTPGKVHPSHHCCYIGFAGTEVSHKVYDVLTRV